MNLRFATVPLLLLASLVCYAGVGSELAERLDAYPHVMVVEKSSEAVIDHEVGLGALQKVRGVWRFKQSERLSGELERHSWQIIDGFSSAEVLESVEGQLVGEQADLLFACDGRSCGHGAQWANRVFRQRVLYGRDDLQRYRVYQVGNERILLYASARTADRQYLHLEVLAMAPGDPAP